MATAIILQKQTTYPYGAKTDCFVILSQQTYVPNIATITGCCSLCQLVYYYVIFFKKLKGVQFGGEHNLYKLVNLHEDLDQQIDF